MDTNTQHHARPGEVAERCERQQLRLHQNKPVSIWIDPAASSKKRFGVGFWTSKKRFGKLEAKADLGAVFGLLDFVDERRERELGEHDRAVALRARQVVQRLERA